MPATPRTHRYDFKSAIPWFIVHLMPFLALWSGVTWQAVALCLGLFWFRMWAVTAVYHRYFSHRTYETSRWFQFVLAVCAVTSTQRGPLWWAAHHRAHHLYSDGERDLHSPEQDGFWHAHVGWVFADSGETDWKRIQDFAKYPELRWLDRWHLVPTVLLGIASVVFFGWPGLFIGFFLSQVMAWHATYVINSLCHVWGGRRFETKDTSRNNLWLALLTLGEGWHNNHHHYMNSVRQGFYWYEIDITYYVLRALAAVGLVWNLKMPPQRVLDEGRRLDALKKRRAAPDRVDDRVGDLAAARTSLAP
ncbi:MAG: acyl-CoA desaturase [Sandaracinaceae bacterium]|nr:acyl-CoA desaturase [Sandaracinaceae bacterium]MCB9656001.1 acyl-CoA desaturase [Sandaracinaceae bacterium]